MHTNQPQKRRESGRYNKRFICRATKKEAYRSHLFLPKNSMQHQRQQPINISPDFLTVFRSGLKFILLLFPTWLCTLAHNLDLCLQIFFFHPMVCDAIVSSSSGRTEWRCMVLVWISFVSLPCVTHSEVLFLPMWRKIRLKKYSIGNELECNDSPGRRKEKVRTGDQPE